MRFRIYCARTTTGRIFSMNKMIVAFSVFLCATTMAWAVTLRSIRNRCRRALAPTTTQRLPRYSRLAIRACNRTVRRTIRTMHSCRPVTTKQRQVLARQMAKAAVRTGSIRNHCHRVKIARGAACFDPRDTLRPIDQCRVSMLRAVHRGGAREHVSHICVARRCSHGGSDPILRCRHGDAFARRIEQ